MKTRDDDDFKARKSIFLRHKTLSRSKESILEWESVFRFYSRL